MLQDLFTLHEGAQCITHDMLACDCQGDKDITRQQAVAVSRPCQLGQQSNQLAKKVN